MVREIRDDELQELLGLYLFLHEVEVPEVSEAILNTWKKITADENYHIIVKEVEGKIVASCTCIVVPNMTRGVTPYALVENVVTHGDYRGCGYASECLKRADEIAMAAGCYKLMLITGSSDEKTHAFYRRAGYSSEGKTAYYKLLKEVNWKKL